MTEPVCPKCGHHDFVLSPVPMPNNDYWNPVVCKACGTIAGQLPSNDEREAIARLAKISTLEEHLKKVLWLLEEFEKKVP